MALSQEATALITKLEALQSRAASGDREVIHFIKSLKTRALSGDDKSRRIYNTLAVIHWKKQKGGDYDKAEGYYNRLKAKEPVAMAKLQLLLQRLRAGDPEARQLFSVLKSIHNKWKSSAFTDGPGAPRIGGYGLPQQHRPGIIIGGAEPLSYPVRPAYSAYPAYPTPSSYVNPNPGHGGGYPMSQPQHLALPVMPSRVYSVLQGMHRMRSGQYGNGPRVGGVATFQPLTDSALAGLLALMARVRAMPLAKLPQGVQGLTFNPSSGPPQARSTNTVRTPSFLSTVVAPSGIVHPVSSAILRSAATVIRPVAEPAICTQARSAVARKSPVAMQLVAACAKLGYTIPYNPADFPAQAPLAEHYSALGRVQLK